MPNTLCHECGAPAKSGSENIRGYVYCRDCAFDLFQECEQCGEQTPNGELNYCGGTAACETCAADLGFKRCEGCECWERSSDILDTGADGCLCSDCAKDLGYEQCDNCKALLKEGDSRIEWVARGTYAGSNSNYTYCGTCADELLAQCEDCGNWLLDSEMQNSDGGLYCDLCDNMPDFDRKDEITGQKFDKIVSELYFGVELETHRCKRYMFLEDDDFWGAKCDHTVRGKEFDSAKMNGDEGLAAVRRLCAFAEDNNWRVDPRCGFHLHIDMTGFTARQLRAIAYAYNRTPDIWESFVDSSRADCGWCDFASLNENKIRGLKTKADWRSMAYDTERYRWLNWEAYRTHGSLELRFHEGTIDCDQVINWIKAHTSFIDWVADAGCTKVKQDLGGDVNKQFKTLCDIWLEYGHTDLCDFYHAKSNLKDLVPYDTGVLV